MCNRKRKNLRDAVCLGTRFHCRLLFSSCKWQRAGVCVVSRVLLCVISLWGHAGQPGDRHRACYVPLRSGWPNIAVQDHQGVHGNVLCLNEYVAVFVSLFIFRCMFSVTETIRPVVCVFKEQIQFNLQLDKSVAIMQLCVLRCYKNTPLTSTKTCCIEWHL